MKPAPSPASSSGPERDVYVDAYLALDIDRREVCVGGEVKHLTKTEFCLLAAFLLHPGKVLSMAKLQAMAGGSHPLSIWAVKAHLANLRAKLRGRDGSRAPIVAVYGRGLRYGPSVKEVIP